MVSKQIDAQIDWACITSVISCIECGSLDFPGKVVRDAALKATTALITNSTLRLAPPPSRQGTGILLEPYDYILEAWLLNWSILKLKITLGKTLLAQPINGLAGITKPLLGTSKNCINPPSSSNGLI